MKFVIAPDKAFLWFGVLVICIFGIIQGYCVIENEVPVATASSVSTVAGISFIGMWVRFRLFLGSQSIRQHGLFTSEEVRWEDVQSVSWHDTRYVVLRHSHGELTIVFARFGKISRSPIIEYIKRNEQNLRPERLELVSKKQRSKPVLVLLFLVLISIPYAFFVRSSPNEARLLWGTMAFVPYWVALFFVGWKMNLWKE